VSIIFFTDGCDTCNSMPNILKSLESLNKTMKKAAINFKYLTIGFTGEHDAVFLNNIATSGTDLGNFFFIDTSDENYPEQIKDCLQSSLGMAKDDEDGISLVLTSADGTTEKLFLSKTIDSDDLHDIEAPQQMGQEEEVKRAELNYEFFSQNLVKDEVLKDFKGALSLPITKSVFEVDIEATLVENPSSEVLARASIQMINKLVFDAI